MLENYYYIQLRNWFSADTMEMSVMLHYPLSSGFILFEIC